MFMALMAHGKHQNLPVAAIVALSDERIESIFLNTQQQQSKLHKEITPSITPYNSTLCEWSQAPIDWMLGVALDSGLHPKTQQDQTVMVHPWTGAPHTHLASLCIVHSLCAKQNSNSISMENPIKNILKYTTVAVISITALKLVGKWRRKVRDGSLGS